MMHESLLVTLLSFQGAALAAPASEVRTALPGIQVNDVAFLGDTYAVGTASGVFFLDRKLAVRRRRADMGSVSSLAVDGGALFIGSECGVFKDAAGRWSAIPVLNGSKGACDGSRAVRAMCLNVEKARKGTRPRKTLFVSLEDTTTENVEPLGLFAYDLARASAAPVTALREFGDPPVTAMSCAGGRVFFGTDDEPESRHPGAVFAWDPRSGTVSLATEGMPRADEDDNAEITSIAGRGDLLLVGRYAGHGTGQCVLAARQGALTAPGVNGAGVALPRTMGGARWSCLLKSEADHLEGINSIQAAGEGFLAGSGLMANVDTARVFLLAPDLAVSEARDLPLRGQLVVLRTRAGKVFLGTTDGLVVLPGKRVGISARPPRP